MHDQNIRLRLLERRRTNRLPSENILCTIFDNSGKIGSSIILSELLKDAKLELKSMESTLRGDDSIQYYIRLGDSENFEFGECLSLYYFNPKNGEIKIVQNKNRSYIGIILRTNYIIDSFEKSR